MQATIVQVAERAGVSKKTVSRVINNEGTVSDLTRRRVLEAIRELGYSPNPWAQNLARGRSQLIALIIDDAASSYIMDVMRGCMDAGKIAGYSVSIQRCKIEDPADIAKVVAMARHHLADGMVFTPPCDNSRELLESLEAIAFPFVLLTPSDRQPGRNWIASSDTHGAYEITRYLIGLGHERIAYIQGNPNHRASWDRLNGFNRALEEAGLTPGPDYYRPSDWSFSAGVQAGRELLALSLRPTAIVTGGDEIAAGVIHAALEQGIRVPEDLSVTGFDDAPLAEHIWPPLTTVRQPVYEMATQATTMLVGQITQEAPRAFNVEMPTSLTVRRSTAANAAVFGLKRSPAEA